jgi:hypothetical protein
MPVAWMRSAPDRRRREAAPILESAGLRPALVHLGHMRNCRMGRARTSVRQYRIVCVRKCRRARDGHADPALTHARVPMTRACTSIRQ